MNFELLEKIHDRVVAQVSEACVDYSSFAQGNAVLSFHSTFLSNFYALPVALHGNVFLTVEHAYQAAKFFNVDWHCI